MTPTDDAWADLGGGNLSPNGQGGRPRPSCPGCGEWTQVEPQRMLPATVGEWICWRCSTCFHGDEVEWRRMADKRKSFRCRTEAAFRARQEHAARIDAGEPDPPLRGATPVSSARALLQSRRLG